MEVVEGSAAMAAKLGAISVVGPGPPGAMRWQLAHQVAANYLPATGSPGSICASAAPGSAAGIKASNQGRMVILRQVHNMAAPQAR